MTMLLAFLLQAAAAPAPLPGPARPPALAVPAAPQPVATAKTLDPAVAIEAFRAICWSSFRDPETFHAAVVASPLALMPAPRAATTEEGPPSEVYRSEEAVLTYAASDRLATSIPPRQCSLKLRLAGTSDQLALAARIAAALGLPSGRTRTGTSLAITSWDVPGADGRTTRLLAISRNGRGGGTDLRLSVLLLAAPR